MSEPVSLSLDDLGWEVVDEHLKKKVLDGDAMTITRYSFAPEGRFPHHVHDQEQATYVLDGSVTFTIEGTDHDLQRGSIVVIPSGRPHSALAGDLGAEVLSVVTPRRSRTDGLSMLEES